jgi:hypothetical protein
MSLKTRLALGALLLAFGVLIPIQTKAADLGGNCCADLEERIASLEVGAATKGTKKVSLTLSGQVSRSVLYWNDGDRSGTYAGLDNHGQSTRFSLTGEAKINADFKAGFDITTEISAGGRTSAVNQDDVDGNHSSDSALAVRTANWWLEGKATGRLSVGRLNLGGPVATIDLGGISTAANASPGLVGGGFVAYNGFGPVTLAELLGPTYGGDRVEGIRWDSPTIAGFTLQAAYAEDKVMAASIRWAQEVGGFRLAAGVGYQKQDPRDGLSAGMLDTTAVRGEVDWGGSAAIQHIASGLFMQGQYSETEFFGGPKATFYLAQGGIAKNWTGLGNTVVYGEYGKADGYRGGTGSMPPGWSLDSAADFFGGGLVQHLDNAAMEVFVGYRRFDYTAQSFDNGVLDNTETGKLDLIHAGARIRF